MSDKQFKYLLSFSEFEFECKFTKAWDVALKGSGFKKWLPITFKIESDSWTDL